MKKVVTPFPGQDVFEDFVFDEVQVTLDFVTKAVTEQAVQQDVAEWATQHELELTAVVDELAGPSGWPTVTFRLKGEYVRAFIAAYNEHD